MNCVIPVVEFDIQAGDAATTSQTVEIPSSGGVQQSDPEERTSGSTPAPEDEEVGRNTASPRLSTSSNTSSLDSWAEFEAEHFENFHEAFLSAGEVEEED